MALKIYKTLEQGTSEWLDVRKGVITGTGLGAIMGTPAARLTYLGKLCCELRNINNPLVKNFAMQRGNDLEDICQLEYERMTGIKVSNIGFATRSPYWGHSPDGIIYNNDGEIVRGIEIKSPYGETIMKYLQYNEEKESDNLKKIDKNYYWQVINYFCVFPDMEAVDFLVFYPYDSTLDKYQKKKQFQYLDLEQYKTGSTLEDEIFIYSINREEVEDDIQKAKDEVKKFRAEWAKREEKIETSKNSRGLKTLYKKLKGKLQQKLWNKPPET